MKGLTVGYWRNGKPIRYETKRGRRKQRGESSLALVGPARSGKLTSVLIPELLEFTGSAIAPKEKSPGTRNEKAGQL